MSGVASQRHLRPDTRSPMVTKRAVTARKPCLRRVMEQKLKETA
ncbi:MAG: hypothetical protein ACI9IV_002095 [Paracoccaceae bacterium]|jgi:hypothetical protein